MKKFGRIAALAALSCVLSVLFTLAADARPREQLFPEPEPMRSAVAFWMRVYLEVTTDSGLLHDSRNLGVVYETIQLPKGASKKKRQRKVDKRRKHWRAVLNHLAKGKKARNDSERAIVRVFKTELKREPTGRDFARAAQRVRFQVGQRDKFRAGLIRSGAYENEMRAIFREMGLPQDLAYLPHVESSFNIRAYSKYGAAGMWQFMRGTGRRYMQVDYVVDERLDPIIATHSAARLLRDNYKATGTWPLAITAYNHGASGMKRAKRKLGTSRIEEVVAKYKSRSFGFASRNFYAQFLAARRVVRSYEAFFGPLDRNKPEPVDEVVLPFYARVEDLETYLGTTPDLIKRYNPALRPSVYRSGKRIPKGYTLRLPAGTSGPNPEKWLAMVPQKAQHARQHRSNLYKVRRGDTLSRIAKRNGTSVRTLVALNNLKRKHRIYPGQVLQLPGGKSKSKRATPKPKKSIEIISSAQAAPPPAAKTKAPPAKSVKPEPLKPEPTLAAATVEPATLTPEIPTRPIPTLESADAEPTTLPSAPKGEQTIQVAKAESQPSSGNNAGPMTGVRRGAKIPPPVKSSRFRRIIRNGVLVDADETLGHFAEWLNVPTSRLRKLNRMRNKANLRMGQRLKLDFSKATPEQFQQRRMEYHKAVEEDFFDNFAITGTVDHTLRKGESLWVLSHKVYQAPSWLIQRYNPDLDLTKMKPGTLVSVPLVEKRS
ncbi:MAG: LysM peptidoglycan-binding domain-containing protein [bacterium]|nr:LysM peptidoglycan-binding domain-containing protein [bacterium]